MMKIAALAMIAAFTAALAMISAPEANAAKRGAGGKMCMATNTATGKKVSWKCSSSEKCCYNYFSNSGSCGGC